MGLKETIRDNGSNILNESWDARDGYVVPTPESVKLAGGVVKLYATMLYADLADSTELSVKYDYRIAAKVFKAFLTTCSRLIKANDGAIRSFDGDRVMGIYLGKDMETKAVKTAMEINDAVLHIVKPMLEAKYEKLRAGSYKIAHCVGVDTSDVYVVRAGVINDNDLVWVGRAPNIAAKLSAERKPPYHTYITPIVFQNMADWLKTGNNKPAWERVNYLGSSALSLVYRSQWWVQV